MGKVIGIIYSSCSWDNLMGLTSERPVATLPFGGRYRLLDFPLSNMVNAGLRTVGIITPNNYRPVLDHLGAGKEWLLDRKSGGLFILPGQSISLGNQKFLTRDLAQNIDFLLKDQADDVILCYSNLVLNIDFSQVLQFHKRKNADITFIYKQKVAPRQTEDALALTADEDDRIQALGGDQDQTNNVFLDMMVIKRRLLLGLLQKSDAAGGEELLGMIAGGLSDLAVYAFPFTGYVGRVASVQSYFDCNMDLLRPEIRQELFAGTNRIYTKETDNPPSRYGAAAAVKNSLVASGCRIEGQVENSIVFRRVHVKPGAVIRNSIVMQRGEIGTDVLLENAILDKFVRIQDGVVIKGQPDNPVVVEKRTDLKDEGGVSL